jgi:3-oxoadipate enol-lactonase
MVVRIDRGGWSLEAERSGEGEKVILLSNSLGADQSMWAPQRALLEQNHTVISYDTRGHGGSDAPAGAYSFDDLVADAIAVLDHFGVDRATYLGLSLGGMTGLGVALGHPNRITRLICAAARADNPEPFVKGWDDRVAAIRAGGMAAIWPGTAERWFTQGWREAHPDALAKVEAMFLHTDAEGYAGCAEALKGLDYLRSLGRISVPTLFIAGEADMGAPHEAMRAMAAATPGSSFVLVEGAAHIVNMEKPEAFNRAVADFLAS